MTGYAYYAVHSGPCSKPPGAIDRVSAHDPSLHAFVALFSEAALKVAAAADERRAQGVSLGPLDGIPFAVKDLFHVAGYPTAAGSTALGGGPATATANAVRRLAAAGMIALGKVQTVEFAFGRAETGQVVIPNDIIFFSRLGGVHKPLREFRHGKSSAQIPLSRKHHVAVGRQSECT
ncbi:amidase family protein [Dongia soli]|uniref:amidase family protein n=1 Tax=Dongia soli TaxID=600628 RepID=UPI00360B342B